MLFNHTKVFLDVVLNFDELYVYEKFNLVSLGIHVAHSPFVIAFVTIGRKEKFSSTLPPRAKQ